MGGPAEPLFLVKKPDHIVAIADVINGPELGVDLPEGLARGAGHGPVNGSREEIKPVARLTTGTVDAQGSVGLLAGKDGQGVVREPRTLVEHCLQFGQPERAGIAGVAVAVELGEVNYIHVHIFEHFHEIGSCPRLAVGDLLHRGQGDGHVPVAGEGDATGERIITIAPCEPEHLGHRAFGRVASDQVKHAEPLHGIRRRIEPGDEVAATAFGLADAKTCSIVQAPVIAAGPDGRLVVGEVARKEKLVRRGKTGHRAPLALDHDRPVITAGTIGGVELEFPRGGMSPPGRTMPCATMRGLRRQVRRRKERRGRARWYSSRPRRGRASRLDRP